jgi:hypothetical protein
MWPVITLLIFNTYEPTPIKHATGTTSQYSVTTQILSCVFTSDLAFGYTHVKEMLVLKNILICITIKITVYSYNNRNMILSEHQKQEWKGCSAEFPKVPKTFLPLHSVDVMSNIYLYHHHHHHYHHHHMCVCV